jgi:hypothetical protein
MPQPRSRPPLATILCLFEFSLPVFAVVGYYATKHLQSAYPGIQQATYRFEAPISILQCIFAVGAGAALWRMSRFAFVLFAARCGLAVLAFFLFFSQVGVTVSEAGLPFTRYLGPLSVVAASAVFTWWVYQLTAPKGQPSRS